MYSKHSSSFETRSQEKTSTRLQLNINMNFDKLNQESFAIYATKNYDTRACSSLAEYNSDLRRLNNVKRLILRHIRDQNDIDPRCLLNHIIILTNVFGATPTSKMLFFICPPECHAVLKSVLCFLNVLPDRIGEVNLPKIKADRSIINTLKEI